MNIDTAFDFRIDTPEGGDPDALSPTLRRYHQILWSKLLPNGKMFDLGTTNNKYLYHNSELGEFVLSSDSVVPTFTKWKRKTSLISQIPPEDSEAFVSLAYTIAGMMVWPRIPLNGQKTMNVARGFNYKIADRMDLTLECIRLYYLGKESPLFNTISAYQGYFSLFSNFEGFVDYFLLQDLVTRDYKDVKFFMEFNDFDGASSPNDLKTYIEYRTRTVEWLHARNQRISALMNT